MPWKQKEAFDKLIEEGAHVVGISRHPRSVLTSKQKGKPYWNELAFGQDRATALDRWMVMAGHLYRFGQGIIPRFTMIRFEDLLTKPLAVQRFLSERLSLESTVSFEEAHKHVDPNNPNVAAMNGIRPLDPNRCKQASDEELREIDFEIPDMVLRTAGALGYAYAPAHDVQGSLTINNVGVGLYAYGGGKVSPSWSFYSNPGAEEQIDMSPMLNSVLAATIGGHAKETIQVEGPCPLPGHDHPLTYVCRGDSVLLAGRCEESGDYVLLIANPQKIRKIKSLPEGPTD